MIKVDVTEEALREEMEKVIELVLEKNVQYADAWQEYGIATPLLRIKEKLLRLHSIVHDTCILEMPTDVDQEFDDIIGYVLLGKLWLRENGHTIKTE